MNIFAKAIGVLAQKNDVWSPRTEKSVFTARAEADDACSSDHYNLQSFYNKGDAVDNISYFVKTLINETGISDFCLVIA
jgi:hypothetical protein